MPRTIDKDIYYSVPEAAEQLGVSRMTMFRWVTDMGHVERAKIKVLRDPISKHFYVSRDSVVKLAKRFEPVRELAKIATPFIPLEKMERTAARCLYNYTSLTRKGINYPLEASKIFKAIYGLEVRFLDFEKEKIYGKKGEQLYACLYPNGRLFQKKDNLILINVGPFKGRRLTAPERLISLAHEGGHYAISYSKLPKSPQLSLSFSDTPRLCSSGSYREDPYDRREYQATLFAACFLMPHEELLKTISYADHLDLNQYGKRLCRKFGVTLSFLKFRLKSLGIKTN